MTWFGIANSGEILHSTDDAGLYNFAELTGDVEGLIGSTTVVGLGGYTLPTGAPQTDQIIKFDGANWSYAPDATGTGTTSHALLGAFHSDTTSHVPVRGDIIIGNATPNWDALALGTAEFVLYSDGTDVGYTRLGQNTPFEAGSSALPSVTFTGNTGAGLHSVSSGIFAAGSNSLDLLTLNGVNETLTLNAGQVVKTRAGGATTLTTADYIYLVTSASVTVTLPASPVTNQVFIVKDRDGLANGAVNQITIDGNGKNIDGNTEVRIRLRYGAFTLVYNGTSWNIV